jgi:NitT/TauT family transport system permease protein
MAQTAKLSRQQTVNVPAVSAQTEVVEHDRRTLARDLLALATIGLVIITYHLMNPLLLHETRFGTAFRNATLQPVLAISLICGTILLIMAARRGDDPDLEKHALTLPEWIAALALGLYTAIVALAVLLRWNVFGAFLSIDQALFTARPNSETPVELFTQAYTLAAVFEWLAIAGTVYLWKPWMRLSLYARTIRRQAAPLMVAVIVLVLWEVLIVIFQIQQFLLPRPSVIGSTLLDTYPRLISAGWNTFQNAFWGFIFGSAAGILTGFAAARFTSFSKALLPLAIAINAVPIIALAPIFNLWFGDLNPASKIAIVIVIVYFPAMISTVKGLTSVDALSLELMKSYAAGQFDIFLKLRLPSALPFIFSALKVSTTLSMIAAIVSEYFGGSTAGLGFRIRDDAGLFKYPEAWSAIFIASAFGIFFYVVVSAVERSVMSWHVSFRDN